MHADLYKYPPPLSTHAKTQRNNYLKNIAVNSKTHSEIWKKSFPLVCRACRYESIDA